MRSLRDKVAKMRKLLPLLACLMLSLAGWSSMVHAAEATGDSVLEIGSSVHVSGDGDEVPADGDNGLPHHHGACHGHDLGTPMSAHAQIPYNREADQRGRRVPPALVAADQSVSLRPPQA
jgi:hypothetical protein